MFYVNLLEFDQAGKLLANMPLARRLATEQECIEAIQEEIKTPAQPGLHRQFLLVEVTGPGKARSALLWENVYG